ncbi:MAG: hypothetical protein ACRKFN_10080 [Desulfitobacterium sp.]
MWSIEVLVAAMHQKDAELYYKLGLKTNAVIANQTDHYEYEEYSIDGNTLKVVSTKDRGVGRNRNIALLHAAADLCVIGDEDLIYNPDYPQVVSRAFNELSDADIIIFHLDFLPASSVSIVDKRCIGKIKRVRLFNFARYGAPRIVFKRESIAKANIWFSLLYGGGARYSAGEDTLFLREALRKGLKIYSYPQKIADVRQEVSTWFMGYTEKYFFDKGVVIANVFPRVKYLAGLYLAIRFKARTKFSYRQLIRQIYAGIKAFRDGASYDQWKEREIRGGGKNDGEKPLLEANVRK